MEQERGISVTSSVTQFPYHDRIVNLLDTPGHEDFSEDTYRTLTAVDSALMVVDGAKGVEERTIKLMNVCLLRTTPIFSFVNKLDRDIRDPIELLDEIEHVLDDCNPKVLVAHADLLDESILAVCSDVEVVAVNTPPEIASACTRVVRPTSGNSPERPTWPITK